MGIPISPVNMTMARDSGISLDACLEIMSLALKTSSPILMRSGEGNRLILPFVRSLIASFDASNSSRIAISAALPHH
jgi:hypothetical protein